MSLKDKVLFITGSSRGIGLAIALKAAADGAKVVIAAKTTQASDKLPGTIYTAAEAVEKAGGKALAIRLDVRDEEQIKSAIEKTVETFGGLDIVINNAGVLRLTGVETTEMKQFDLMHAVNTRAVFMMAKYALPHLRKSANPHILSISPPLNLEPGWFRYAYTLSKYGMSMCTMGFADQFKEEGIAVNSLWPETTVDTSAVRNLLGGDETVSMSRKPEIVADAAYWILTQAAKETTGNFFIDSQVLRANGVTDLSKYAVDPSKSLVPDFFIGKAPASLKEALSRRTSAD